MRGFFSTIIFSSIFVLGCNYKVIKDPAGLSRGPQGSGQKIDSSALISWLLVRDSVLRVCLECHSTTTNPSLVGHSSVIQHLSKVISEVSSNAMPPAKNGYEPLSNCQKQILATWAQAGAPDSTNIHVQDLAECQALGANPAPNPELPLSQTEANYKNVLRRILQPKCIKCHNPDSEDSEAAAVLFFPYSEIKSRSQLWSSPARASKIIELLTLEDADSRMPKNENPLSREEIEFIIRWIDSGKPQ